MPTPLGEPFLDNSIIPRTSQEIPLLPFHRSPSSTLSEHANHDNRDLNLQQIAPSGRIAEEGPSVQKKQKQSKRKPDNLVINKVALESQPFIPSSPASDSHEIDDTQMRRRSQDSYAKDTDQGSSTGSGSQNGHANGTMNKDIEMRRKNAVMDSPTQTENLMSRESFSLDDEPPITPRTPTSNTSFFELPRQDRRNFMLLVLLYFLQGVPMGLAGGSVPFLLKSHLSYGQIGIFTLASYPYSLKLLWSPIVDAVWSPRLGRRKSWILPIQVFSGLGMLYMGGRAEKMMVAAGAADGSGVWTFTWWWFFLVFLCATQDIAVDGMSYCPRNYIIPFTKMLCRLGTYSSLTTKSLLRINRPNCRSHSRPIPLLYRLPSLQFSRLCQSLFPYHTFRLGGHDTRRLS